MTNHAGQAGAATGLRDRYSIADAIDVVIDDDQLHLDIGCCPLDDTAFHSHVNPDGLGRGLAAASIQGVQSGGVRVVQILPGDGTA